MWVESTKQGQSVINGTEKEPPVILDLRCSLPTLISHIMFLQDISYEDLRQLTVTPCAKLSAELMYVRNTRPLQLHILCSYFVRDASVCVLKISPAPAIHLQATYFSQVNPSQYPTSRKPVGKRYISFLNPLTGAN